MNVVFAYADSNREWNCSQWRCITPARAMRAAGHTVSVMPTGHLAAGAPDVMARCEQADVIIIERMLFAEMRPAIDHWRGRGVKVVADFDDAYHLMPTTCGAHKFWGLGQVTKPDGETVTLDPHPLDQFRDTLKICDLVTTPSALLSVDFDNGMTTTGLRRNYPDMARYRPHRRQARPAGPIILGWGGSMSHLQSWTNSGIGHAIKRVMRQRREVMLQIHGADARIFEQCGVPKERIILRPWVPAAEWPAQLAGFDVGLAPLAGEYDKRRSWIKALEYCAVGIPWAATDNGVYEELAAYGELADNTPMSWQHAIERAIDGIGDSQADAIDFAEQQDIGANVGDIITQLESI